jgi:UDP-glucose 4-epimerase
MTTWLVTGGAGYIGSHVARALVASGREVVVYDDFSHGLRARVAPGVPVVHDTVLDPHAVAIALRDFGCSGVIHLAAIKAAGESVEIPLTYYRENVDGVLSVLEAMKAEGVSNFVYSSSAAVYGTPAANPVDEDAPLHPESPYGETKVIGEWASAASGLAWDLRWAAMRYFNVAGAGADELGDNSVNNLIPMVFQALADGRRPRIFGDDYPTPDGTCIRDYIHVVDLADAHVAAAAALEEGAVVGAINVGRGEGSSVREVMDMISEVIGRDVDAEVVGRRAGDPAATWASTARIERELGWYAGHDLRDMVTSAWSAWQVYSGLA